MQYKTKKGFTLVELLVVIAIIGLLSTIAFISLNNARAKARDAKRVSDVRQVQSALELYYNDQTTPSYPYTSGITANLAPLASAGLSATYVAVLPVAPQPEDGSPKCSAQENSYRYQDFASTSGGAGCSGAGSCGWYTIRFCIGSATGGLQAGVIEASPSGILWKCAAGVGC